MNTQARSSNHGFVTTATTIREVMTAAPQTIEASATVTQAHEVMQRLRCRHLPVVEGGALVGILSERDVYIAVCVGVGNAPVDKAMSRSVYTTTPDAKVRDVARVLAAEKYGSAVVLDGERIVGIFTTTDAFRHLVAALRDD